MATKWLHSGVYVELAIGGLWVPIKSFLQEVSEYLYRVSYRGVYGFLYKGSFRGFLDSYTEFPIGDFCNPV